MVVSQEQIEAIRVKYTNVSSSLNERERRLWAANEALSYGWGGLSLVCKATGLSTSAVRHGIQDIKNPSPFMENRVRQVGGGRKKLTNVNRGLRKELLALVEPMAKGDPMSSLLWSSKSTKKLAEALKEKGYNISHTSVGTLLRELGYTLQANQKSLEGNQHVDRDAQFAYINKSMAELQSRGQPTISVDTKKKENIGNYKNNGEEYSPKGKPIKVETHDFPDKLLGKVVPYGIYDIGKNKGWVSVGISSDTAEFAVNAIRTWWYTMGSKNYPDASELLITADCGGSNGYRVKLWKCELQKFATETGITIHVRHFPPGTSKWNKIEHKLFSYISKNWRGRPLISTETVINLISNTSTRRGLEVKAVLDRNNYETGKEVSEDELKLLNIIRDEFHPEWNYSIIPRTPENQSQSGV